MKIKVGKDQFALIDDEDFDLVRGHTWRMSGTRKDYAVTNLAYDSEGKRNSLYMHRLIMGTPKGMETDHINGNGLDNRKSNLRVCTPRQNQANSGLRSTNTSGYKGVVWRGKESKWLAKIRLEGSKVVVLGRFNSKEEAAEAYRIAAVEQYGEFVKL